MLIVLYIFLDTLARFHYRFAERKTIFIVFAGGITITPHAVINMGTFPRIITASFISFMVRL